MLSYPRLLTLQLLTCYICAVVSSDLKPNIVIILADDLGFDDVSFRGSNQFLTPNIDALAFNGVVLNHFYTPSMCTPSRAALLTGKYPISTGMQHYVIPNFEPWGLPLNETTMAQVFQNAGYRTTLIGKWHLGFSRKSYTPTLRGFNEHYGYLGAFVDYYNQSLIEHTYNLSRGHDFRHNLLTQHDRIGTYVTDLLTEAALNTIASHDTTKCPLFMLLSHLAPHAGNDDAPMQAPMEEIDKFAYIANEKRRIYAAMVSKLDDSVRQVVDTLAEKNILNNTIILFYSDNGGPTVGQHSTNASNYPLRGQKNTPWEGGIRSSAAIWSQHLQQLGSVWEQKMYVADLLPTLASAAGIEIDSKVKLDGLNWWTALRTGAPAVEREIVHNIDEIFHYTAYLVGKWKYINGSTSPNYNTWLGSRSTTEVDPRAVHYEAVLRNTSVWQHLAAYNPGAVDVSQMRKNATVTCEFHSTPPVDACDPLKAPCFYNIEADPCEQHNLYEEYRDSELLVSIQRRLAQLQSTAHAPNNKPIDELCDPKLYDYEWTWWEDEIDENAARGLYGRLPSTASAFTLVIALLNLKYN